MILLTYAASLEMKGIKMVVVDQDLSQASRLLVSAFSGSPFFDITHSTTSYPEAESMLTGDKADVILHIQNTISRSACMQNRRPICNWWSMPLMPLRPV